MRYKITGRNINVTPGLKAAVEEKIGKLERYFNQDTEAIITLSVEKERQKIVDKKQAAIAFSDYFMNEEYESDDEVKIVKVKRFAMKPMDPEEACVQMELLGHAFYVFLNSETDQVNVVYKRKGNTYGLIEPEF